MRKSTYFVRFHRNNSAEGEDEGMHVLHVEVVGGYGIRHRVVGQHLVQEKVEYNSKGQELFNIM